MTIVRVILVLACALAWAAPADAQTQGRTSSFTEAASTLVMPFDLTNGKQSYQLVSKIGAPLGEPLRTHWVYYAADCRHLADVDITLTDDDTTIVDATRLQNEQQLSPESENQKIGPIGDLTGERGVVFVTSTFNDVQLTGAWTIADPSSGASYAFDAIGLTPSFEIDPAFLHVGGVRVQTFNPESLTGSEVIVLPIQDLGGTFEPIGQEVCCDVRYTDAVEASISMPDFCFECAGFAAITSDLADDQTPSILPATSTVSSPGILVFENCRTVVDGTETELDLDQGVFAFHGQSVGPFGAVLTGRYTRAFVD